MRRLFVIALAVVAVAAVADSPLTSTDIASAYVDVPAVSLALRSDGVITTKLIDFLDDAGQPIDSRIAVINALGWDGPADDNLQGYLERVFGTEEAFYAANFGGTGRPDRLLCSAYLAALSAYNDVEVAHMVALKARAQRPGSYTYALVTALIKAQLAFDTDWCAVFETVYDVDANPALHRDMRPEAILAVFDYIGLYREYCN